MNERHSGTSASRNGASDPSAPPGKLLSNPAVQRKFYDAHQSIFGPPQLAFIPPGARDNDIAGDGAELLAKNARYRHRAVWAQALVLFNVVGLPLSHGTYFEHYYSATLPKSSLSALSVIPAVQILCILGTPLPIGMLYHWRGQRSGWRPIFLIAMLLAFSAQLSLQWTKTYIATMLLHGPVLGSALGTLSTLSTLVLSTHYRHNLPLVSMQSSALGFLGAIVHTVVATQCLRTTLYAPAATAGIFLTTSLAACTLMHRVQHNAVPTRLSPALHLPSTIANILHGPGASLFLLGYMLVFAAMFVFPVYSIAVLSLAPALVTHSTASWVLLTTLSTAAVSACIGANPVVRKRVGPVNTFVAACVLAGAASVVPACMLDLSSRLVCGAAYGFGLGAVLALHVKVSTVFHGGRIVCHCDVSARAAVMMALAGGSACAGIIVSAKVMESVQNGVQIVACVAAGCLGLGGVLIALARWRRCRRFYVAI